MHVAQTINVQIRILVLMSRYGSESAKISGSIRIRNTVSFSIRCQLESGWKGICIQAFSLRN